MEKLQTTVLVILLLTVWTIKAQTYDFTADNISGCSSLNVQFSISDTNGIVSVAWDFGNGVTSDSITPPVVTYDTSGVYDVSLTINGTIDTIKNDYITVFPTPVASFSHNDSVLLGSYNVLFIIDRQPEPFDTVQYYYNWDFGDDVQYTANQRQHGHRYPDEGSYDVLLSVSDRYGCSNTSAETITVYDRFDANNIFTPNNDNINDFFVINTSGITVYSLKIFGRSGALVYKTEGPILIWDGKNNSGVKMAPGVYFYIVKELSGAGNTSSGFVYMYY